MRRYIVINKDRNASAKTSTPLRESLRMCPRVDNGRITIGGKVYVVDPNLFIRMPYRPKRFLKLVTEYVDIAFWIEDNPEPLDMLAYFDEAEREDDITGEVMAVAARAKKIRSILQPETNWLVILLVLSIIGNMALAGVIYSVTRNGGT